MIRLVVVLIGLFLLWLWLASPFIRRTKTMASLLALILAISAIAYEVYDNTPRHGLIGASQIIVCGLSVNHSYRSDYKVVLCLQNTTSATLKRVTFQVMGKRCKTQNLNQCDELEMVSRDRLITIEPSTKLDLQETVRFERIAADDDSVSWSAKVLEVKAVP